MTAADQNIAFMSTDTSNFSKSIFLTDVYSTSLQGFLQYKILDGFTAQKAIKGSPLVCEVNLKCNS